MVGSRGGSKSRTMPKIRPRTYFGVGFALVAWLVDTYLPTAPTIVKVVFALMAIAMFALGVWEWSNRFTTPNARTKKRDLVVLRLALLSLFALTGIGAVAVLFRLIPSADVAGEMDIALELNCRSIGMPEAPTPDERLLTLRLHPTMSEYIGYIFGPAVKGRPSYLCELTNHGASTLFNPWLDLSVVFRDSRKDASGQVLGSGVVRESISRTIRLDGSFGGSAGSKMFWLVNDASDRYASVRFDSRAFVQTLSGRQPQVELRLSGDRVLDMAP